MKALLSDYWQSATISVDRNGRVCRWDRAAEHLLGWLAAEVLEKPYPLAFAPVIPAFPTRLERILRGGSWTGLLLHIQRRDGDWLLLDSFASPFRDGRGKIIGMTEILTDVSPCLAGGKSLYKAVERLCRQREQKGHGKPREETPTLLTGSMAYDLHNLLTLLMGHVAHAEGEVKWSVIRDHLRQIGGISRRAADLCKLLLAYAESDLCPIVPTDLNATVLAAATLLRQALPSEAVLRTHLAPSLPPVLSDAGQLQQVVFNLATNAAESLQLGGGFIDITTGFPNAEPATPSVRTYVCLEVRDTGCGIDSVTMARMFDPLFTTKGIGRGPGLSVVWDIVRRHHGLITADSRPGQGSTFSILLPVAAGPDVRVG